MGEIMGKIIGNAYRNNAQICKHNGSNPSM